MTEQPATPSPMVLKYFLLLFLGAAILAGRLLWPFISILILSFLLSGIFQPVYSFLKRHMSPFSASLLTCFLVVILVFVPLSFFVGSLSKEAYAFYQLGKDANLGLKLQTMVQESTIVLKIQRILDGYGVQIEPAGLSSTLSDFAKIIGLFLYKQASSWATNILSFVFNFFMMIITIFFLLIEHGRLVHYLLRLSPLPDDQGRRLIKKFEEIASAVLIGNGICGLLQGVLGGAVFAFFHLGPPILWGAIMAILAFLPIFGIGLVLVPMALILLLKGNTGGAVAMLIFYLNLSFSVEYLLKPKLVGEQVKMHTLLVFLSIMGGLSVFGFLGIIYGPLIMTAFITLAEIYLLNYELYIKTGKQV